MAHVRESSEWKSRDDRQRLTGCREPRMLCRLPAVTCRKYGAGIRRVGGVEGRVAADGTSLICRCLLGVEMKGLEGLTEGHEGDGEAFDRHQLSPFSPSPLPAQRVVPCLSG